MKKFYLLIGCLITLSPSIAQTDFKKDSLESAQRNTLMRLENERLQLEQDKLKLQKASQEADEAKAKKQTEDALAVAKLQKDLIGSTPPTALTGAITISKGDAAMAETRAIVLASLSTMIFDFIADMNTACVAIDPKKKVKLPLSRQAAEKKLGKAKGASETASTHGKLVDSLTSTPADSSADTLTNKQATAAESDSSAQSQSGDYGANPKPNDGVDNLALPLPSDLQTSILVYQTDYFKIAPDYELLVFQIEKFKKLYTELSGYFKSNFKSAAAGAGLAPAVAIGKSIIDAIAGIATYFRTETDFKINQEVVDEETIVSGFRMLDNNQDRHYYYPAMMPLSIKNSLLMRHIESIEVSVLDLRENIEQFRETEIVQKTNRLEDNRTQRRLLEGKIKALRSTKPINIAAVNGHLNSIKPIQGRIMLDSAKLAGDEVRLKVFEKTFDNVNGQFEELKKALMVIVDEKTKSNVLRQILIAESFFRYVDAGAYVLKISAHGIGTNRIRKTLVSSSLKHSAFTESNFMLFQHRRLILTQTESVYKPFIKARKLKTIER